MQWLTLSQGSCCDRTNPDAPGHRAPASENQDTRKTTRSGFRVSHRFSMSRAWAWDGAGLASLQQLESDVRAEAVKTPLPEIHPRPHSPLGTTSWPGYWPSQSTIGLRRLVLWTPALTKTDRFRPSYTAATVADSSGTVHETADSGSQLFAVACLSRHRWLLDRQGLCKCHAPKPRRSQKAEAVRLTSA